MKRREKWPNASYSKYILPPLRLSTVRFGQLSFYLHQIEMHPVVSQIVHVPDDWKRPGSWREAGRPTVSDPVHHQDENCSEQQQGTDAAVRMGAK